MRMHRRLEIAGYWIWILATVNSAISIPAVLYSVYAQWEPKMMLSLIPVAVLFVLIGLIVIRRYRQKEYERQSAA